MPEYSTVNAFQIKKFGLLEQMIRRFRRGQVEPLIVSDTAGPIAALIRIEDYERLAEYDRQALAAEHEFRQELSRRTAAPVGATGTAYDSVEDLIAGLGLGTGAKS